MQDNTELLYYLSNANEVFEQINDVISFELYPLFSKPIFALIKI